MTDETIEVSEERVDLGKALIDKLTAERDDYLEALDLIKNLKITKPKPALVEAIDAATTVLEKWDGTLEE